MSRNVYSHLSYKTGIEDISCTEMQKSLGIYISERNSIPAFSLKIRRGCVNGWGKRTCTNAQVVITSNTAGQWVYCHSDAINHHTKLVWVTLELLYPTRWQNMCHLKSYRALFRRLVNEKKYLYACVSYWEGGLCAFVGIVLLRRCDWMQLSRNWVLWLVSSVAYLITELSNHF